MRVVDVNVRGPVKALRTLLPPMAARGRGAVVLMSSLAGSQGTARLATYAASKAFNKVLAEGLWSELQGQGIDVLACCAGGCPQPRLRRPPASTRTRGRAPMRRQIWRTVGRVCPPCAETDHPLAVLRCG